MKRNGDGMMSQTIVMPIHNEEKLLLYSLRPLLDLPQYIRIIIVLDRCTDRSEQIIKWFARHRQNVKIVHKNAVFKTANPAWDAYLFGSEYADHFLYWIGADIVINPEMFDVRYLSGFTPLKFQYIDYPNHLGFAYFKLLSKLTKHYCCEVFEKSQLALYDFPREELIGLSRKQNFRLINLSVMHMRKTKNNLREYTQGFNRRLQKESFVRVVLHSILFWKPYVLIGYLYGR